MDIMVEEVLKLCMMLRNRTSYKRMSGHNVLGILQFSQNLVQNGFEHPDPYHQLDGLSNSEILLLKTHNGGLSFYDFVTLEETKRNEMLNKAFTDKARVQ